MRFCYRAILICCVLLLIGCAGSKEPKPAPLVGFQPTLNIQKQWVTTIGKGTDSSYLQLTPVIVNGKIFANSGDGEIVALGTQTGRKIWKIKTKLNLTSGLAAAGNLIFVGTDEGQIVAIKQQDGMPGWWRPMSSEILATPYAADNIVLVKDENGTVRAFTTSGKVLWTYAHEEPSLILRGSGSPQVFANNVVVGFANGELTALKLDNGQVVWSKIIAEGHGTSPVQRMVDIDVDPQIVAGIIYVATYQGKIAAVALTTGRILWQYKLSSYSGLAVSNEHIYVSDDDDNVWAFDTKTGAVIWKQSALAHRKITGPAIIGNAIVVGDVQGYLHFMDQSDGHFVARVRVDDKSILIPPIIIANSIYAYTSAGKLAKFIVY
jgi:outer membrane protein assembly factor BamB